MKKANILTIAVAAMAMAACEKEPVNPASESSIGKEITQTENTSWRKMTQTELREYLGLDELNEETKAVRGQKGICNRWVEHLLGCYGYVPVDCFCPIDVVVSAEMRAFGRLVNAIENGYLAEWVGSKDKNIILPYLRGQALADVKNGEKTLVMRESPSEENKTYFLLVDKHQTHLENPNVDAVFPVKH